MFNTGLFLVEVQKRPCLWKVRHSDHNDRELKLSAWEEIVEVFNKCDSYYHQNITVDVLQRKWKYLRDYYIREKKRTPKVSKDFSTKNIFGRKRPSPLLEMLKFLDANQRTGSAEINVDRNESDESSHSEPNEEDLSQHEHSNSAPREMLSINQSEDDAESEDKRFLGSLLPVIRNMSSKGKLNFREQLKNLISNTGVEESSKTPGPHKRRRSLDKIEDDIESRSGECLPKRDEFSIYGEYVANKLRNIENVHARNTAEFYINGILYKAEMGEYDKVPEDLNDTRSTSSIESSNVRMESLMYDEENSDCIIIKEDTVKTEILDRSEI